MRDPRDRRAVPTAIACVPLSIAFGIDVYLFLTVPAIAPAALLSYVICGLISRYMRIAILGMLVAGEVVDQIRGENVWKWE